MSEVRTTWRRQILLVDRRLQFKFVAIFGGFSTLLSVWSGSVYYLAWRQSDLSLGESPSTDLTWFIVGTAGIGVLSAFLGILVGHRVAGPAFVVARWMSAMARGEYPRVRPLRDGDDLQGLHKSFNDMMEALKRREEEELSIVSQSLAEVQRAWPQAGSTLAALEALRLRKETRLRPPPKGF